MRDHFLFPAQTNLELCAQALAMGWRGGGLARLNEAHHLALRQVHSLVRGSGKPFIAHLVGTASLVLASGKPEDWVIGAMLHALYQRRVPFENGLAPAARRPVISDRFGAAVDDIVHRYTILEDDSSGGWLDDSPLAQADVVTLRLADELEDLSGYALALHGRPGPEDPQERGGFAWRRNAKLAMAPRLLATAERLQLGGMARGLTHWLDFSSYPEGLSAARTGLTSSATLRPAPVGPEDQ